jgi:formylmethanofuran dehydrogenase subunit E
MCPGLAIGIRAAEIALHEIGAPSQDEETVAVVETDMCGVDAIQVLTGCTFGKGNLIHRDYGKRAFSFYRRSDGKAVRIVALPGAFVLPDPSQDAERRALAEKQGRDGLTEEEKRRFSELQKHLTEKILQAPLKNLFEIKAPSEEVPSRARLHASVACDRCGEEVMATRIREVGDKRLCIPCSKMFS